MQIRISKNPILIWLLLCSLFLTSYISVFNIPGMLPSDLNVSARSSMSGGSGQMSMNGAAGTGYLAYLAADTSIDSFISLMKQSRGLFSKSGFDLLTAVAAAQIISFICSSRLSEDICSQFNSIKITFFLHKKDGMK